MKRLILFSLAICYFVSSYGQLFDSISKLFLGYTSSSFVGGEMFNAGGTIAPSFYRNLQSTQGITIGLTYKLSDHYSLLFSLDNHTYTTWKSEKFTSYNNTSLMAFHFCPAVQYHTAYSESGLYNRLKLFGNLSPVITFSRIYLPIHNTEHWALIDEVSFGPRFTVGAEYALTNQIGLFANTSLQQSFVKSQIHIDTSYLLQGVNIGLNFTLSKPKSFNY